MASVVAALDIPHKGCGLILRTVTSLARPHKGTCLDEEDRSARFLHIDTVAQMKVTEPTSDKWQQGLDRGRQMYGATNGHRWMA